MFAPNLASRQLEKDMGLQHKTQKWTYAVIIMIAGSKIADVESFIFLPSV